MRLLLICLNNNNRYLSLSITDTNEFIPLGIKQLKNNISLQFTILYEDYLKYIEIFNSFNVTKETTIPHYDTFTQNSLNSKIIEYIFYSDIQSIIGDILKNTQIIYNRERILNDLFKDELRDDK